MSSRNWFCDSKMYNALYTYRKLTFKLIYRYNIFL